MRGIPHTHTRGFEYYSYGITWHPCLTCTKNPHGLTQHEARRQVELCDQLEALQARWRSVFCVERSLCFFRPWENDPNYPLVMTNSSPWKDPPFLRTVNHLFLWAIEKPWRTVSHNQMVSELNCVSF